MKRAAVICASGIVDGLLMMIASHHLNKKLGYKVFVFHDYFEWLSEIFPECCFSPHPPLNSLLKELKNFSIVLVENDNSQRAHYIFKIRIYLPQIFFFFPTPSNHFQNKDYAFDPKLSFATNMVHGTEKLLKIRCSKENGIYMPNKKDHSKHKNRVIIHPTSGDSRKNWQKKYFLQLAVYIEKQNYNVVFCIAPNKIENWKDVKNICTFDSSKELSKYIFKSGYMIGNDSGIGHLASNLGIPTLTISGNLKRTKLWRPDWCFGIVVTPKVVLPNFKGINLHLRDWWWNYFVKPKRVLKHFNHLVKRYESCRGMFCRHW